MGEEVDGNNVLAQALKAQVSFFTFSSNCFRYLDLSFNKTSTFPVLKKQSKFCYIANSTSGL